MNESVPGSEIRKNRIPLFLLLLVGVVAGIAIAWQASIIVRLRSEVDTLRKDLRTTLSAALDHLAVPFTDAEQARREKLELIKLRHQVRELTESIAAAHGKPAKFRELLGSLLPAPAPATAKLRPEWKGSEQLATNHYAQAMRLLRSATNEYVRYLNLGFAAKMSLAFGRTEDARQFATDMLVLNEKYSRGSRERVNGHVIHDANLVLGRIALDEGRLEDAKKHLLAAGKSPGSSNLASFGPNMSLAKELLQKGEVQTVLQYFELVRKFWKSDQLDEWTKDIHAGRIPDFGANLLY